MPIAIAIAVLAILLTACRPFNPHAHRFTTSEPQREDVSGSYQIRRIFLLGSLQDVGDYLRQYGKTRIELRLDGTFRYVAMPWIEEPKIWSYHFAGFREGNGSWSIVQTGSVGSWDGKVAPVYGVEFDGLPAGVAVAQFTGKDVVTGLIFTFSDPDEG